MSGDRVRNLVEGARRLAQSGDRLASRRLLEQALVLQPAHEEARSLLAGMLATSATAAGSQPPSLLPRVHRKAGADRAPAARPVPEAPTTTDWGRALQELPPAEDTSELDWGMAIDPGSLHIETGWNAEPGGGAAWEGSTPVVLDTPTGGVDPLELVAPLPALTPIPLGALEPEADLEILLRGVRKLLSLDDHSAAVELLGRAERLAPDHSGVQQLKARSEATLMDMMISKLGDLQHRPQVRLEPDEIIWLNLDHRAGFVLAQIDGTMTFEELFAVSGMSRLDTARILAQLVVERIVA